MTTTAGPDFTHLTRSLVIKGEISGTEDVYVDGQLDGSVQLSGNRLTVGPNGRVKGNVSVQNITVAGALEGNIQASERTEMRKTSVVNGDVQTCRIAIEEGAFFKGKLEIVAESKSQKASTG